MKKQYVVAYCGRYDTPEEAMKKAKELAKEVGGVFEIEERNRLNEITDHGLFVTATEVHDFSGGDMG